MNWKYILIIIILSAIVGGGGLWCSTRGEEIPIVGGPEKAKNNVSTEEQACIDSGGTVITGICCKLTSNFPNLCLIGPCGCSPTNSHEVKICDCGEDKCFDGNACIARVID